MEISIQKSPNPIKNSPQTSKNVIYITNSYSSIYCLNSAFKFYEFQTIEQKGVEAHFEITWNFSSLTMLTKQYVAI